MTNYYRGSKAPVKAQKADAENRSGTYRGVKHDGRGNERRKMNHGLYRGGEYAMIRHHVFCCKQRLR